MTASTEHPPQVRMHEQVDQDGALRLAVGDELDLTVIDAFRNRVLGLKRKGCRVRLDLAQLEFIDSGGK